MELRPEGQAGTTEEDPGCHVKEFGCCFKSEGEFLSWQWTRTVLMLRRFGLAAMLGLPWAPHEHTVGALQMSVKCILAVLGSKICHLSASFQYTCTHITYHDLGNSQSQVFSHVFSSDIINTMRSLWYHKK